MFASRPALGVQKDSSRVDEDFRAWRGVSTSGEVAQDFVRKAEEIWKVYKGWIRAYMAKALDTGVNIEDLSAIDAR